MWRTVDTALLEEIARRIRDAMSPEQIILFGSHAWGTPHADSDVDLFVVVKESDKPSYELARDVHRCLRGLGVPVDAVVRTRQEVERSRRARSSLAAQVMERGRVLYG